jgi:chemotaxis protein methyltransferase CheR
MTPHEFHALAQFVRGRAGIALDPAKRAMAAGKLRPVVARFGFRDVSELIREMPRAGAALGRDVVAALTTNETSFFRDRAVFDHIRREVFPALLGARAHTRRLRIWCNAVSTGQEAYSIAMIADEFHCVLRGWTVEILASDIAPDAILRAREGRYDAHEIARGLSRDMLVKHFRPGDGDWRVDKSLRARVSFGVRNLVEPFADLGVFDLILCRNVLIYFDAATKEGVLHRLSAALAPDGFLVLGAAETMLGFGGAFAPQAVRGVYARARGTMRRRAARQARSDIAPAANAALHLMPRGNFVVPGTRVPG